MRTLASRRLKVVVILGLIGLVGAALASVRGIPDGSGTTTLFDQTTQTSIQVPDSDVTGLVRTGRYTLPGGFVEVRTREGRRTINAAEAQEGIVKRGYGFVTSDELKLEAGGAAAIYQICNEIRDGLPRRCMSRPAMNGFVHATRDRTRA